MKSKKIKLPKFKYFAFKDLADLIKKTELNVKEIKNLIDKIFDLKETIKQDNEILTQIYFYNKNGHSINPKKWLYDYNNDFSKEVEINSEYLKIKYSLKLEASNRYIYVYKHLYINNKNYRSTALKGVIRDLEKLKKFINKLIARYGTTKQKIKLI